MDKSYCEEKWNIFYRDRDATIIPHQCIAFFKKKIKHLTDDNEKKQLSKLLNNYEHRDYEKDFTPYIEGPKDVYFFKAIDEVKQMRILLFGEQHIEKKCKISEDIPEWDKANIVEYFERLIKNSPCFVDIYFEIPAFTPKGDIEYYKINDTLSKLYANLQQCIDIGKRSVDDCNISRIHYVDIRTIGRILTPLNVPNVSPKDIVELRFSTFNILKLFQLEFFDVLNFYDTWNIVSDSTAYIDLQKYILGKQSFKDYIEKQFKSGSHHMTYINKQMEKTFIPKEHIISFIENEYNLISEEVYFKELKIDFELSEKEKLLNFERIVKNMISLTTTMASKFMDIYTICRMFRKFKDGKPEIPSNIIFYGGNMHTLSLKRFLEYIRITDKTLDLNVEKFGDCIKMDNWLNK